MSFARLMLVAVLLAGASLSLLTNGCRRHAASPQRTVVLYTSADQEYAQPIVAEFERQSGIKVLARYDTEASKTVGLAQKLRAEASAPVADVFWSSEVFHTVALAREGHFKPFEPPGPAVERPRDANNLWQGLALRGRVISYNTTKVTPQQAPSRLEDLLDPQWKGRVIMANPQFGTTGGDVASWFAHYGPQRTQEILRGLKANGIRIVEGNSTVVRMVGAGQADIGLTDTDDVYAAQRNGWPVAMNYLDQGDNGALAIPNTVAIIQGCPNPSEAAELAAFLLSPQVERMLAQSDSHNSPVHPELADEFPQYAIPKPLAISWDKVADELAGAIRVAGEILR